MKNFKNYIAIFLSALFFTACEKDLTDLKPIDQIPAEVAISTMTDVVSAMNGVYGTWNARRSSYLSSTISDEMRLGVGTEYRNVGNILFNWQHVSDSQDWRDGESGGAWTNLYAVIDRANRLLELMVPVPTTTTTEAAQKNQIRGEMLALRAMAHLELLRWYSITPEYTPTALGIVVQSSYVKNTGSYKPARQPQSAAITLINADLTEARNLIPTSFIDIGRVTRNAVIATQARVALHVKDWQGVIDRTTEVINLQPLSNRTIYPLLWTTRVLNADQTTEVIWKLNVTSANIGSAVGSLWQDVGTGAVQASPAVKLLNTFTPSTDVRFNVFFRTTPRNLIAKYGVVELANGENFQYDIKMIRTSEMVLARAEAYAELNQLTLSNNDLSLLRTARISAYTHTAISDKATLVTAILEERYKELCYEGQRYFDLRRKSLAINRDINDAGGLTAAQTLLPTNSKYILPIPQQETFANPNIGQNPGY